MLKHRIHSPIARGVETLQVLVSIELIAPLRRARVRPRSQFKGDAVEEGGDWAHQDAPAQRG